MAYSAAYDGILREVAGQLNTNPDDLKALIAAESGWNPAAYNPSGAVGLIQFMPQTLKDFGLLSSTLSSRVPSTGAVPEEVKQAVRQEFLSRWPSVEAQLRGPVLRYLSRYAPFPTKHSLYLAVFYPAARTWEPSRVFPENVRRANPGIDTVADYVAFVDRKNVISTAMKTGGITLGAIAVLAAGAYLLKG